MQLLSYVYEPMGVSILYPERYQPGRQNGVYHQGRALELCFESPVVCCNLSNPTLPHNSPSHEPYFIVGVGWWLIVVGRWLDGGGLVVDWQFSWWLCGGRLCWVVVGWWLAGSSWRLAGGLAGVGCWMAGHCRLASFWLFVVVWSQWFGRLGRWLTGVWFRVVGRQSVVGFFIVRWLGGWRVACLLGLVVIQLLDQVFYMCCLESS